MSEDNCYRVPEEVLQALKEMGEFRPCTLSLKGIDQLLILEEDCSYTEHAVPGSNIAILRKNHGDDADKVVGVVIYQWSHWLKDE